MTEINNIQAQATKGTINPFVEYRDVFFYLLTHGREMVKGVSFWTYTKSIEISGMYLSPDIGCIICNTLPKRGYHMSSIYPEMVDKGTVKLLNHLPIRHEDAVFLDKDRKVLYFDHITEQARECTIIWKDYGYYSTFTCKFDDGTEMEIGTQKYDENYTFLQSKSIFPSPSEARVIVLNPEDLQ